MLVDQKPTLQALVKRAETEFFPWATKWVAESLTIENDEQLKNANDLLGLGKFFEKAVEEHRVEEKAPLLAEGKRVDEEHNKFKERIHLGVVRFDNAIILYHRKKKAEADALLKMQAEEQERKRKAAEEEQFKQMQANVVKEAECIQTGEVFEPTPITPMPEPEELIMKPVTNSIKGNMSSTSIITDWDYQIVDDSLIPRDCCSGDLKKIKAKHKYDGKPITGVLITPRTRTVTRLG